MVDVNPFLKSTNKPTLLNFLFFDHSKRFEQPSRASFDSQNTYQEILNVFFELSFVEHNRRTPVFFQSEKLVEKIPGKTSGSWSIFGISGETIFSENSNFDPTDHKNWVNVFTREICQEK